MIIIKRTAVMGMCLSAFLSINVFAATNDNIAQLDTSIPAPEGALTPDQTPPLTEAQATISANAQAPQMPAPPSAAIQQLQPPPNTTTTVVTTPPAVPGAPNVTTTVTTPTAAPAGNSSINVIPPQTQPAQ